MKRIFILVALIFPAMSHSADSPLEARAKAMKGKTFTLRIHEHLLGGTAYSRWDSRPILSAGVTVSQGALYLNGHGDPLKAMDEHFISENVYQVTDVSSNKKQYSLLMKLRAIAVKRDAVSGQEIQLQFSLGLPVDQFDDAFHTIFFRPTDDIKTAVAEHDAKLIRKFVEIDERLAGLSTESKSRILKAMKALCVIGDPQPQITEEGVYLVSTLHDGNQYNDIRVSKNQRIATTIDSLLAYFRRAYSEAKDLEGILEIKFHWKVAHRDFLREKNPRFDDLQLFVRLNILEQFTKGNASAFEMVQESLLRVDGTKVTLTSYEPIR